MLEFEEYVEAVQHEGSSFAEVLRSTDAGALVPTCEPWSLRDLTLHLGEVHRWATAIVAGSIAKPSAVPADHLGALPGEHDLIDWFVAGHAGLVDALRGAPPDLAAFTFLADSPSPRTFWARRQAHETGMHRVDAAGAASHAPSGVGAGVAPFAAGVAADGIDELLVGFATRPRTALHSPQTRVLAVAPTDHEAAWLMTISDAPPSTERIESGAVADADCVVRGRASDVFAALWNRPMPSGEVATSGDPAVFDLFRSSVQISW